jgi:tRNA dimethylallyltransferase
MPADRVLTIVGPTASGKTDVSFHIAQLIASRLLKKAVIISADSRQVYKHIPVASSYPPEEYLKKIKHYFIGELEPHEEFNAGEFGKRARDLIGDAIKNGEVPVIVGGSGLYISSLIYGLFDYEDAAQDSDLKAKIRLIRKTLTERIKNEGVDMLFAELRNVDNSTADKMDNITPRRVIRALEVYYLTGIPVSVLHRKKVDVGFKAMQFGISWGRESLYERINRRVDKMIEKALVDEVKSLIEKGYNCEKYNSLNTVGIKEVFDYLNGKINYDTMLELIKRNTRRFAKRQMTWFRKDKNIKWMDVEKEEGLIHAAERIFNEFFG